MPSDETDDAGHDTDEDSENVDASTTPERGPDEAFCRDCGTVIDADARFCPECGAAQTGEARSSSTTLDSALEDLLEGGNPFVAAVLSAVFPGLGQLYNRELEKGLVVIVASIAAVLSAAILIGFVLYPAVWIYAIYDAYKVAERQSRERRNDATGRGDRPEEFRR